MVWVVVVCRLLLVLLIRMMLVIFMMLCLMFCNLLLFVGVSSRMNRFDILVISVFDWFMFMVLISIMLKFVFLYSCMVLWVWCVMFFSFVCEGEGWMKVWGLWLSVFIWVLLLRIEFFECVELGFIVSIVMCSLWLVSILLNVLMKVDFLMLGVFESLMCSVCWLGSFVSSCMVCVW